jgi:hypothetical protein
MRAVRATMSQAKSWPSVVESRSTARRRRCTGRAGPYFFFPKKWL